MKNDKYNNSRRAFLGFLIKAPIIPAAVLLTRKASAALAPPVRQVLMNDFPIAGFRYYDGTKDLPLPHRRHPSNAPARTNQPPRPLRG